MTEIKLTDDIVVTYKSPNPGFDPTDADNEALEANGFPPRHDDPVLRKQQDEAFYKKYREFKYIVPSFKVNPHKYPGPRIIDEATGTSKNWSGAEVFPASGQSIAIITGTWTVPTVSAGIGNATTYYCSSWVGIDGDDGSSDVCQAGVDTNYDTDTDTQTTHAWVEWDPLASVQIPNFPVKAGDIVSVTITTTGAGATSANVYFVNWTALIHTSIPITAPNGTTLAGNCAECIVERPTIDGALSLLANYGSVEFTACVSTQTNGTAVTLSDAIALPMSEDGQTVSTCTILNPASAECTYVGGTDDGSA